MEGEPIKVHNTPNRLITASEGELKRSKLKTITMNSLKELVETRVKLTPTVYYSTYLTLDDLEPNVRAVYVYDDAYTIELMDDGQYRVIIGNTEFRTKALVLAEDHLWDEFLVDELGIKTK